MNNFYKTCILGEGTYGVVYKGQNKQTGQVIAIKEIEDERITSTTIREISLLKSISHPNIVKLEEVFMEESSIYLIFEFLSMDLYQYMNSLDLSVIMEPSLVKSFLYQINSAILYCHQLRIMHRDLKPQNLLIDKTTRIIKLADFGLSRTLGAPGKVYTHEVVTLWYRAPEVLLGSQEYSYPVDIWAIGCIFAEMTCKKPLFPGHSEINQLVCIFRILRTPTERIWPGVSTLRHYRNYFLPLYRTFNLHNHVKNLDKRGMDLLKKMLVYDPTSRITAADVDRHEFFCDLQLPSGLASRSPQ